jgi:magnesium chelatase subunit D
VTRRTGYPFAALVGLDSLKLTLQLAAIDHRLSVLIRGDKGSGKSTAARGLSELIDPVAPFVDLPIGATEDRLLGGLDVEKALKGEPSLKHGLLSQANGGVLYIDEVNLLPDHLGDALLDAVAGGLHTVEREGFSASHPAEFVLVGSMNPEEGNLGPQLLDRFALAVDVEALMDAGTRAAVLARRLAYDADAPAFRAAWAAESRALADRLSRARGRWSAVSVSDEMLGYVSNCVIDHGVRSLRADLAVVRAARALAALDEAPTMSRAHVDRVLPFALAHRARQSPRDHEPPSRVPEGASEPQQRTAPDDGNGERVFGSVEVRAPRVIVEAQHAGAGADRSSATRQGVATGVRRTESPRELDVRATIVHAALRGEAAIRPADLHEKVRQSADGSRYIFVVDASGSHAVGDRMRLVKGAVAGLLDESQGRHDEVVIVACRGASASIVCEPTRVRDLAMRTLEYLPTGGRTPLAHALELAAGYVTPRSIVIVVTDGRANVPRRGGDAWADALAAGATLGCPALIIDTEDGRERTGNPKRLAEALAASYVPLGALDQSGIIRVIRGEP